MRTMQDNLPGRTGQMFDPTRRVRAGIIRATND